MPPLPESTRKWREANRERVLEQKRATAKRAYAARKAEIQERTRVWREANRDKIREAVRAKYLADPDAVRAYNRENRKDRKARDPERVTNLARMQRLRRESAKRSSLHSAALLADIMLLEQVCQACGGLAEELDHIWPLSQGGCSAIHNLQWLCAACNRSKGAKTMREWTEWLLRS